jgi:hypothetical protein
MKLGKIICVIVALYSFFGHATKHTDAEMREMMKKWDQVKLQTVEDGIHGIRCPLDKNVDEIKLQRIQKAFDLGLYSSTIRDELKAKHMYPEILFDVNTFKPYVGYLCQFGCFSLSTRILVQNENKGFHHLAARNVDSAILLGGITSEYFFDSPIIEPKAIESIIRSKEGEEENLLAFELENNATLRVTVNHGMVLSDGRVVSSQNVKTTDAFVDYAGAPVKILNISNYRQNEGTINFRLKGSKTGINHIMGAEGVLVGDHAWQTDMEDDLNGIAIRRASVQ